MCGSAGAWMRMRIRRSLARGRARAWRFSWREMTGNRHLERAATRRRRSGSSFPLVSALACFRSGGRRSARTRFSVISRHEPLFSMSNRDRQGPGRPAGQNPASASEGPAPPDGRGLMLRRRGLAHLTDPAPADPGLAQGPARNGTDRVLCIGFLPKEHPEGPAAAPAGIPSWGSVLAGTGGRSAAYAQGAIPAASARRPCRSATDAACALPISIPARIGSARRSANTDSCQSRFDMEAMKVYVKPGLTRTHVLPVPIRTPPVGRPARPPPGG